MGEDFLITADKGQIIGRRKQQEDSLGGGIAADGSHFFVLADGMGGHAGGRQAGQAAVAAFSQAMRERVDLRHALDSANACLAYLKNKGQLPESAGCTLIGVSIAHGLCHAISVGDSLLYHFSEKTGLRLLNVLHNKGVELDMLAASGQITVEQARSATQRHALTSAVTGSPLRRIHEPDPFYLEAGDRLVLVSDGCLTLGEKNIEAILHNTPSYFGAEPKSLIKEILQGVEQIDHPSQDNTSLIIIQASKPAPDTETRPFAGFPKQKRLYPAAFSWRVPAIAVCGVALLGLSLLAYTTWSGAGLNPLAAFGKAATDKKVVAADNKEPAKKRRPNKKDAPAVESTTLVGLTGAEESKQTVAPKPEQSIIERYRQATDKKAFATTCLDKAVSTDEFGAFVDKNDNESLVKIVIKADAYSLDEVVLELTKVEESKRIAWRNNILSIAEKEKDSSKARALRLLAYVVCSPATQQYGSYNKGIENRTSQYNAYNSSRSGNAEKIMQASEKFIREITSIEKNFDEYGKSLDSDLNDAEKSKEIFPELVKLHKSRIVDMIKPNLMKLKEKDEKALNEVQAELDKTKPQQEQK